MMNREVVEIEFLLKEVQTAGFMLKMSSESTILACGAVANVHNRKLLNTELHSVLQVTFHHLLSYRLSPLTYSLATEL
ncbi:hypothetical protein ACTXT7_008248 [Hymenolepis weldensis]